MNTHNPISKQAAELGMTSTTSEENKRLLKAIIDGQSASSRLSEGNMAVVVVNVDTLLRQCPQFKYLRDDLISEGFLALVKLANKVHRMAPIKNHQGLIGTTIRNALLDLIRREREVPLTDVVLQALSDNPTTVSDLRQDLLSCCADDKDHTIIAMREAGYTDEEIAGKIGITRPNVTRRRAKLRERWERTQSNDS